MISWHRTAVARENRIVAPDTLLRSLALLLLVTGGMAHGKVVPGSLFVSHAVIQQGMEVPVWGSANEGEQIEVDFAGQTASTTAKEGKWTVRLKPIAAGGPFTMTIKGENTVTLDDVLVGEVWICSGQSNMERQLGPRPPQPLIEDWEKHVAEANYPQIRCFTVEHRRSASPLSEVKGDWVVCSPETVANFTAVGYFFGRDLYRALNIPIGLIHTSVGGTVAEDWTSRAGLEADPRLAALLAAHEQAIKDYPAKLEQFKQQKAELMKDYEAAVEKAKQEGKPAPRAPAAPANPTGAGPTTLYNAMIAPLEPYAMRGVIWYQGESNNGQAALYRTLFPALIADWRKAWGEGDFPFLFVQIAPQPTMSPQLREAQLLTWKKTPQTAMVVITDHGSENIHPPQKEPVGARLALAARCWPMGKRSNTLARSSSQSNSREAVRSFHSPIWAEDSLPREAHSKASPLRGKTGNSFPQRLRSMGKLSLSRAMRFQIRQRSASDGRTCRT